jgi:hypothetical protein
MSFSIADGERRSESLILYLFMNLATIVAIYFEMLGPAKVSLTIRDTITSFIDESIGSSARIVKSCK